MKKTNLSSTTDNTAIFTKLWDIVGELRNKLDHRFELHPDASTEKLEAYSSSDGKSQGSLKAFFGPEIDWLIHSWLRNAESNFSNMHLTISLGTHIRVPHLAFAFGTFGAFSQDPNMPDMFFYMDYISRTDLSTDIEYLDRYYEPINQTYLKLNDELHLSPIISKSLYIREVQLATSLCRICPIKESSLDLIQTIAHDMIDRWLIWVDEAEPLPEDERAALAKRDLLVRRTIAERDPGNEISIRIFGKELAETLIRALWGGDRIRR